MQKNRGRRTQSKVQGAVAPAEKGDNMKKKYTEETRIGTYNCDRNRVVKLSGILQATQEAGRKQMAIQKPSYDDLQAEGKALMLSRLDLEIYETLYFDELVTISSWPCESARATFLRRYVIERDGRVIIEASTQWALVDMETRKVLKTEEVDFSNYYMGEYKELYKEKLRLPKDAKLNEVGKYEIHYSDLDYNGHMNNTYYADVLCDRVPEIEAGTHRIGSFRIHYSKEASLGETFTIMRGKNADGKYMFKTLKENGEVNITAEIGLTEL